MAIKIYTESLAGIIPTIFESKSIFTRVFGGDVQTITGAEANENFLAIKVSDTDVVIQDYSTDPAVAFGAGTGNSSRFGERREIKSEDVQVAFDTPLAIHEGIDRFTVNDIPDQVVAERLALHTVAWAERADTILATTLASQAGATLTGTLTEEDVVKVFNDARSAFVQAKVSKNIGWVAFVKSEVFNLLVDSNLATTAKNSTVDMNAGELYYFKGFELVETPDELFQEGDSAYLTVHNIGVAGVGIPVTRAIDSEDFAGVALQAAGKFGKYIPEKNEAAIIKAQLTAAGA